MIRKLFPVIALVLVISASVAVAADDGPKGVVNINTATVEQLQLLPRIGPALSKRIVEFREANGEFKSIDELVAVKGIGEKSIVPLKPYLAVKGDTTLKTKVRLSLSKASE